MLVQVAAINNIQRSSHFLLDKVIFSNPAAAATSPTTSADILAQQQDLITICLDCARLIVTAYSVVPTKTLTVSAPACSSSTRMSALPQGMFAARKVRDNMSAGWERSLFESQRGAKPQQKQQHKSQEKQQGAGGSQWGRQAGAKDFWAGGATFPNLSQQVLEHPPARYNSKLMNSIWGLYNRYSVHNIKQIQGDVMAFGQQQPERMAKSSVYSGGVAAPSVGGGSRAAPGAAAVGGAASGSCSSAHASSHAWEATRFLGATGHQH